MKICVTGSAGMIGSRVCRLLQEEHKVVPFDIQNGQDILDSAQLENAMRGCEMVIHLAASLEEKSPGDLMSVNVLGTWNVLKAAEKSKVSCVIFLSSMEVLGVFKGERKPDYLPLDDAHPTYPADDYQVSKYLGEKMCRAFSRRTGIPTICLRFPGVFEDATYDFIVSARRENPDFEWSPFWQFGAFLDVRDAAEATRCALFCPALESNHATLLLCADDISSSSQTSRELVSKLLPDVEWRGGMEYSREPFKALIDTRRAQEILGWKPRYKWRPGVLPAEIV